ncbi:hypothetical protein Bbelb_109500 [Branchiostoma belcheri]|nr:hypothetical protein Bbelb_109500 [Branchiostoma belcheri]
MEHVFDTNGRWNGPFFRLAEPAGPTPAVSATRGTAQRGPQRKADLQTVTCIFTQTEEPKAKETSRNSTQPKSNQILQSYERGRQSLEGIPGTVHFKSLMEALMSKHLRRNHKIETSPHEASTVVAAMFRGQPKGNFQHNVSCMPASASTSETRQDSALPALPSLGSYTETSDMDASAMCSTASTSASTGVFSTCALPPVKVTPFTLAKQAKLPEDQKHRITGRLCHYLVKSLRPYATVEDPYFRALMKELNPLYKDPNRACVAERIIPEMYNAALQSLKSELKEVDSVALTGDGWTSRTADHYLTLTAHYLDNWELKAKVLQTLKAEVSQTGDNIAVEIEECMQEFALIGKVEVMTTDNARAMINAISKAGIGLSVGCFAHTLNLALQKVMSISYVQSMVGMMRPTITYFKNSYMGKVVFKEKQVALNRPRHSLLLDCKTRWNSSYAMVSRFLEQYPAVVAASMDDRIKTKPNFKKLQKLDIAKMEGFARVMFKPFQITEAMSAERRPTSGQVLPMIEKLRKHLCTCDADDTDFMKKIKGVIWDDLKMRYQDLAVKNFFEEASALDPRFKGVATEEAWERLTDAIEAETEQAIHIKKEPEEPEEVANQEGQSQESVEEDGAPAKRRKLTAMEELFKDEDDEVIITHQEPPLPVRVRIERERDPEVQGSAKTSLN